MPALPIDGVLGEITEALENHGRAVLVAAPGAGKTTRVPIHLLQHAAWLGDQRIIMLEPRRIAARAAARHMAALMGEEVGRTIGYRTRMDVKVSAATRIEIVTEGIFTRMILDDPELSGIGCVIFDEFHERSLDADLALAFSLDTANALRDDLRLLVMSATMDAELIAELLGESVPVISSQGRSFPVEISYQPKKPDERLEDHMAKIIRQILREEKGSILAFLPGIGEIRRLETALSDGLPQGTYVAPLYGALSPQEQDRAIKPAAKDERKIVLATTIAQTSITIDGVRAVVDSGLVRQPVHDAATGLTRLETVRASLAAADQRAGRAGRTAPGIAIRLWPSGMNAALPAFDPPEIFNSDLSRFLLDCFAWGVTDPAQLSLPDQPPAQALKKAQKRLQEAGVIDANGLTQFGQKIRALPLPVPLAIMVAAAQSPQDAERRALLAYILTERAYGRDTADLDRVFSRVEHAKGGADGALRQAAHRLAKRVQSANQHTEQGSVGAMLLDAYPDRLARRRGQGGRYVMANGRGFAVEESNPLAGHEYLVGADLTGASADLRLLAGAPVTLEDALAHPAIKITQALRLEMSGGKPKARSEKSIGAIVLSSAPVAVEPGPELEAALASSLKNDGLEFLTKHDEIRHLLDRLRWLAECDDQRPWPDMSEETLCDTADNWLLPFLAGKTSLAQLSTSELRSAVLMNVPSDLHRDIDKLAPTHFEVPTGSRIRLRYEAGKAPVLSVRVQELFGLKTHPGILGGKVPLVLELLSPAHRPIQTTMDLPRFWQGSWADVRADMRGRYPKHVWPENPAEADPTRRAKPRG